MVLCFSWSQDSNTVLDVDLEMLETGWCTHLKINGYYRCVRVVWQFQLLKYMGMCLLQETNSSLSLERALRHSVPRSCPSWYGMTWHDMAWMQIFLEVSSLLRTNCTRTCVVYTIQEVSPCAKTKQMQMQMKVKVKMKMFGQRFHLWRSFQQAPISFHFIQWIWSSARSSLLLYQFISNWDYSTLPFSEEDRITQHVTCNDFDLVVELPEQVELEASTSTSTSTIVLRSARASFLQYSTHLSPLIAFYCSLVRGGAVVGATSRTYTYSEFMDGWFVAWRT